MSSHQLIPMKKGYGIGLLSGLTWGIDTTLLAVALAISPFSAHPDLILSGTFVCCLIHIIFETLYMNILVGTTGEFKHFWPALKSRGGLIMALGGIVGGPIAMTCYLMAIEFTGAAMTTTVSATYPLIGCVVAILLLKERVTLQMWIGILLAIFGVLYAGSGIPITDRNITIDGCILALVTAVGWGLESVCCRYATNNCGITPKVALLIREYVCLIAYLLISPFFLGGIDKMADSVVSLMSYSNAFVVVAIASCFGALSMYLWYKTISIVGAARGLCLNITYCVWTSIFACFIFHSITDSSFVLSGALVTIAGVALALWDKNVFSPPHPVNNRH